MDSTCMEQCQNIHAAQKKKVKCFNCGGPHYRSTCPLPSSSTGREMRQKSRKKRSHCCEKNQCKNVVSFAADHRERSNLRRREIGGRFLHFLLDITSISRGTWKRLGSPILEPCAMPVKIADGSPMKVDGRFTTDFSVKDRITGETIQGKGLCYVTESENLLGLDRGRLPVTRIAIEEESRKDKKVSQVVRMLQTGKWPAKPNGKIRNSKALSHALWMPYFGHRIVIPATLQERVLKQLNEGHPGMTKMKMLVRG
ncbi:hypothetical protein OESDEN_07068 [Oesophagostomum dentatum]|uniref:Uncharacterized protein n=1 Tax=Oesophagostomum dentatum TaxID=61180 RepID=A0A0B1TB48_OESDE|nr:hypothetical protein OESDEN_07068 [Oesophagostomum dentatum]